MTQTSKKQKQNIILSKKFLSHVLTSSFHNLTFWVSGFGKVRTRYPYQKWVQWHSICKLDNNWSTSILTVKNIWLSGSWVKIYLYNYINVFHSDSWRTVRFPNIEIVIGKSSQQNIFGPGGEKTLDNIVILRFPHDQGQRSVINKISCISKQIHLKCNIRCIIFVLQKTWLFLNLHGEIIVRVAQLHCRKHLTLL